MVKQARCGKKTPRLEEKGNFLVSRREMEEYRQKRWENLKQEDRFDQKGRIGKKQN